MGDIRVSGVDPIKVVGPPGKRYTCPEVVAAEADGMLTRSRVATTGVRFVEGSFRGGSGKEGEKRRGGSSSNPRTVLTLRCPRLFSRVVPLNETSPFRLRRLRKQD